MDPLSTAIKFFQDCGLFIYPSATIMALGVTIAIERFIFLSKARNENRPETERVQQYMALYQSLKKRTSMFEEAMTRTARLTEKIAVLRACVTGDSAHSSSGYYMTTGYPHQPIGVENAKPGAPNDWPSLGGVVRKVLRPRCQLRSRFPSRVRTTAT